MKYYIAFSIHGTNTFVTASININSNSDSSKSDLIQIGKFTFSKVHSRRSTYKPTDGIKLHSDRLLTKTGKPMKSHQLILKFFNELRDDGWVINKEAFIAKHWKQK